MSRRFGRLVLVIVAWLLVGAHAVSAQQPFSDKFSGTTLNPGWIVSSPNPDSSVGLTGSGYLLMTASPLNGGSDLYSGSNYNAPVILQPVDPAADWTITIRLVFDPTNNYQGAGILLATQAGGFTSDDQFDRIAERAYYPGGGGQVVRSVGDYSSDTDTVAYLRVTKKGHKYTGSLSSDGKAWTKSGSANDATAYSYVGLFTLRQPWDGDTSVYSAASFDYFKVKVQP